MEKLKYIKIENQDGTFSNPIPVGADASRIDMASGNSLQAEMGNIDYSTNGSVADQLSNKLEVSNILAGSNVTLTTSGNNITISSTGGGGGSINDGVPTNGVIGFDGLASEIPGGYEVTTDPFPGSGGSSDVNIFYDTVALMKADENLSVGKVVGTLGYYTANDGAAAIYQITNDSTLVADNGSVHELANGLKAQLIVKGNEILVDWWGTKKTSTEIDTAKIQKAFNYGVENNKIIVFNNSDYYIDNQININNTTLDKDVYIKGNNAKIYLKNDNIGFKAFYLKAKSLKIENLTIDGANTTQDQFDETVIGNLKVYTAFDILTDKVELNSLNILNMYGNAFVFYNYSNITAKNIYINNVGGHWYQNDTYDAFGDAFYFGAHSDRADIYLENIKATGKYKNTTLSRIGITIENLNQQLTDTITNIDMTSCYFYNYDRMIHAEAIRGNAIVNWHDGEAVCDVFGFNFNTNVSQLTINGENLNINFTGQAYNGSKGQYKCKFYYNNCNIHCGGTALGMFGATGTYENCVVNNIATTQFNGSGKILFVNSILNYASTMSAHLIFESIITFDRCTFSSSTPINMDNNFSAERLISCTFDKVYPTSATRPMFLDLNTKIYTDDSFVLNDVTKRNMHMATVYDSNGKIIMTPHISQVFPMEDVSQENYYGRRTIPADGTISLMPSFDGMVLRPNNKYILITIGASGWTTQYTGRQFTSFYYNIVTTDSSSNITVGATQTIGTVPANYVLTINDTNKTIARNGQYTDTCNQWLLPYNYTQYLANWTN